ncbi:MAG: hypothetical protein LBJ67_04300 [Planctomycetaceae bacterium]|jgi:hypothetical protein|nr:hypothetical protein [Planctomycetaceae bacterium]
MLKKLFNKLSWNENYIDASIVYIGLAFIILGASWGFTKAFADYCDCPEGTICVQMGEGYECQCSPEE